MAEKLLEKNWTIVGCSHFEGWWTPNYWHQVKFWDTPEIFWVWGFKWATLKLGGIMIERGRACWIFLWWIFFFKKHPIPESFQQACFWEQYARHSRFRICMLKGSHGLLCMRYSSPKSADASGHEDIVRILSDIVNCISACICTM